MAKNRLISTFLAAVSLVTVTAPIAASMSGCAGELEFNDPHGHPYHHRHWRDEEVYQHEDGRWYARRHGDWVVVEDVR